MVNMKISRSLFSFAFVGAVGALPLQTRNAGSTSYVTDANIANDVANGVCAPLTMIFARGTNEAGNVGKDVGPPLFDELIKQYGKNIALQGVNYSPSWLSNDGLGASGGPAMAALVNKVKKQCPSTKVVLGGYSQGAMVVHNAMATLTQGSISAAVVFGDPMNGIVPSIIATTLFKEFCATGDNLCHHQALSENINSHLSYGVNNATEAAQFIIKSSQ